MIVIEKPIIKKRSIGIQNEMRTGCAARDEDAFQTRRNRK
jgi:hypothetical protein